MQADVRDFQRRKVYQWEWQHVHVIPNNPSIAYDDIAPIVAHVWQNEGLIGPPLIKPLPRQTRRACAKGFRDYLQFPQDKKTLTTVIIHELAHALAEDKHGPQFVGKYLYLLDKYCGLNMFSLTPTLRKYNIKFTLDY